MDMIQADVSNALECLTLSGPYFSAALDWGCYARSCFRAWRAVARGLEPDGSGLGLFYYVSLEQAHGRRES